MRLDGRRPVLGEKRRFPRAGQGQSVRLDEPRAEPRGATVSTRGHVHAAAHPAVRAGAAAPGGHVRPGWAGRCASASQPATRRSHECPGHPRAPVLTWSRGRLLGQGAAREPERCATVLAYWADRRPRLLQRQRRRGRALPLRRGGGQLWALIGRLRHHGRGAAPR